MKVVRRRSYRDGEGNPVDDLTLRHARYQQALIRHDDETITLVVEAHDGTRRDWTLSVADLRFVGASLEDGERRDLPEDVQDVLMEVGFVPLSRSLAEQTGGEGDA